MIDKGGGGRMNTIAEIKRELPEVSAQLGGRVYRAIVTGRGASFARIPLYDAHNRINPALTFEVSWAVVLRCYNAGTPVII